jgi:capsular exopolysaccharide synthesis family protein
MSTQHESWSSGEAEEVHLREYLRALARFKGSALTTFLIVVVTIMLFTLATPKQYQAVTQIMVVERDPNVNVDRTATLLTGARTYFDTQVEILRAKPIFRETLELLKLEESDLVLPHPLLVWIGQAISSITGASRGPAPKTMRVENFQTLVQVTPVRDTDVVKLSVRAKSPELAQKLAATLVKVFASKNLALKRERSTSDRVYLSKRLESTKQSFIDAENELRRFEKASDTVSLEDRIKYLTELRIRGDGELTDVEQKIEEVSARLKSNLAQLSSTREGVADADSAAYAGLQKRLLDLRLQKATMLKTYTRNHPKVLSLNGEIELVENKVARIGKALKAGRSSSVSGMDQVMLQQSQLQQEFEALTARSRSLRSMLEHYYGKLMSALALKSQYEFLRLEVNATQQIYDLLLIRQKEASLKEDMQTPDVSVIDPAELSIKPVRPRPALSLAVALLLGSFVGVFVALFRSYMDQKVRDRESLEEATRIPCLAELPIFQSNSKQREIEFDGSGPLMERITQLHLSSTMGTPDDPAQVFLVTSAIPGEGKTTVASHLALSFSMGAVKTLLIDCDLRKPQMLKLFQVPEGQPGVRDLVHDLPDLLPPHPEVADLTVVGSREPDHSPTQLLGQQPFARMLMQLRKRYDRIVIDSPPVNAVGDALHLGPLVDRVLLVTRANHSELPSIQEATRVLGDVRARMAGIVLNGMSPRELDRYGYGYGYGYRNVNGTAPLPAPPGKKAIQE